MGKIYIGAYNKNTPQFKFKKMKNGHIHMSRPNTCSLYIYRTCKVIVSYKH